MSETVVGKVDFYKVKDGASTALSVVVGKGQPGGVAVTLDGEQLGIGPAVSDLVLGSGEDLHGKEVRVVATVVDNNPATDETAVSLVFTGGVTPKTVTAAGTAVSGQRVVYTITVSLL